MVLKVGMKFQSKWFNGTTEILAINEKTNILNVQISATGRPSIWTEEWNLQHTIWGFQRGDYRLLTEKSKS